MSGRERVRAETPARIVIDRDFTVGPIDDRIYGSLVEHMERVVYGGIYEPGHPCADARGFRTDVIGLVRELGVPIVRYPGGNFVSGYDWEDGVGPPSERPPRLDLAWIARESNEVGLNEFLYWAKEAGVECNLAVNLGLRRVDAARNLVEYCNFPRGSYWSDLRVAHGVVEPHGIKTWCLGNEMDGPWQIGAKSALDYGRLACEAARAMRRVDPGIELVACGSSTPRMRSFPDWDVTVLEQAYDEVDYLSLHTYFTNTGGDSRAYLARSLEMDRQIEAVVAACDLVRAKVRSRKRLSLSFDEWGIWSREERANRDSWSWRWKEANAVSEGMYSFEDALLAGSMLLSLIRHADRIKIACWAQLVNHLSLFSCAAGGPVWKQTVFYPFAHAARFGRGIALALSLSAPVYDAGELQGVPVLDAAAVLSKKEDEIVVFAVNRDLSRPLPVEIVRRGFAPFRAVEHILYESADLEAGNTREQPGRVVPSSRTGAELAATLDVEGDTVSLRLPAASWNVIRLRRSEARDVEPPRSGR